MKITIDPARTWYVCRSKPGQTFKARTSIHEAGFDAYCPIKRKDRIKGGIRVEYSVPLMPPYIFVGFLPAARHFGFVRNCDGVSGFLTSAEGFPLFIPAHIIQTILIAEMAMEYDETERAKKAKREEMEHLFPPGSAVRLVDNLNSLLAGFEGIVLESKRGKRRVEFGGLKSWLDVDKIEAA